MGNKTEHDTWADDGHIYYYIYNYTKEFLRLNVLRRHCRPICTERIFTPLGGKSIAQSQTNKQENVCQKYV